jgi:hypothetical protein
MTQRVWSRIGWVFIGPEGLRAGGRFLLFAFGILLGVRLVEEPLSQFLAQRFAINLNDLSAPALLIRKFVLCVSVFLVTAIAATVERRRVDSYGLPVEQAFGKFFWKGMLAGLLVVVFVAGAMILTGGMALHGLALHGNEIAKLGLVWFVANVLVGVGEEYAFRGYPVIVG